MSCARPRLAKQLAASPPTSMRLSALRAGLWGLVGLAVVALGAGRLRGFTRARLTPIAVPGAQNGVDGGIALDGRRAPAFTLRDQFGRPVALERFRHQLVVLAFIDSRGETIDPLTARTLADAKRLLGRSALDVKLVAVNASPVATSIPDVRAWSRTHGMLRHWLFLTSSAVELRPVWREYAISVTVIDGQVVHTPAVYVLAPGLRETWAFQTPSAPSNIPDQAYVLAEHMARTLGRDAWPTKPAALTPVSDVLGTPAGSTSFRLAGLGNAGQPAVVTVGNGHGALVDFFATWCHACVQDLRVLNAYARLQHRDRDLPPVMAVDLRIAEPSTAYVRSFVVAHGVHFPIGLDTTGSVFDRYGVTALPSSFVVSPGGRILWSHVGVLPLDRLVGMVRAAERRHPPP